MDSQELLNVLLKNFNDIVKNPRGYKTLYEKSIIENENGNSFDRNDYYDLIVRYLYMYHRENEIESLCYFKLPITISRETSYKNFKNYIETLGRYKFKHEILPDCDTFEKEVFRLGRDKLAQADGSWLRIYSSSITKKDPDLVGKIYLSIDNKDLHKFSKYFITSCVNNKLNDYEFKINNNEDLTRKDNVVIYFTKENYNKYIKIIYNIYKNEIIQRNKRHPLAFEATDEIYVASDFMNNNQSYSEIACKLIINFINDGYSNEEAIRKTDKLLREKLREKFDIKNKGSHNKTI